MDRRQRKRFDLSAPVTYSWGAPVRADTAGHGTTRDVSECGVFVLTDCFPPLGVTIELEVSFPFSDDSQIQMKAKGKVVRLQTSGEGSKVQGFAAVTQILLLQNPAFTPRGEVNAP